MKNNVLPMSILLLSCLLFITERHSFSESQKNLPQSQQDIINLDFNLLEEVQKYTTEDQTDLKEIPENIKKLDGKIVRVTGYFITSPETYYKKEPVRQFAIGKNPYGCPCCSWGDPPTIFNTLMVDLIEGENLPPPFSPMIEVTGTFLVRKEHKVDANRINRLDILYRIKQAKVIKIRQSLLRSFF